MAQAVVDLLQYLSHTLSATELMLADKSVGGIADKDGVPWKGPEQQATELQYHFCTFGTIINFPYVAKTLTFSKKEMPGLGSLKRRYNSFLPGIRRELGVD